MSNPEEIFEATKKSVGSTALSAIAAKSLTTAVGNTYAVQEQLTPTDQSMLRKDCPIALRFENKNGVGNCHPYIVASRNIIRHLHYGHAHLRGQKHERKGRKLKTVVIGATMRELNDYAKDSNIHFVMGLHDNKDIARTVVGLKAKMNAMNFVAKDFPDCINKVNSGAVPGMEHFKGRVHLDVRDAFPCDVLLLEDVGYNFDEADWLKLFYESGASIAHGYMALPWELHPDFSDMPTNPYYRLHPSDVPGSMTLVWKGGGKGGYSTGYTHNYYTWSLLMMNTVLKYSMQHTSEGIIENGRMVHMENRHSKEFAKGTPDWARMELVVELNSRVGPMQCFSISPAVAPAHEVRLLVLPDHKRYIRVLDLWASVNHRTLKTKDPVYVSIPYDAWWMLVAYFCRLKVEQCTFENGMNYVARVREGIQMNGVDIPSWGLPNEHMSTLVLAALLWTGLHKNKWSLLVKDMENSWLTRVKRFFTDALMDCIPFMTDLIEWLYEEKWLEKIVKIPATEIYVVGDVDHWRDELNLTMLNLPSEDVASVSAAVEPAKSVEKKKLVCKDCIWQYEASGNKQIIECHCTPDKKRKFVLTHADRKQLCIELADTDNDPTELGKVKKAMLDALPPATSDKDGDDWLVVEVEVDLVEAGPGAGKSYTMRKFLQNTDALVYCPNSSLLADYAGTGPGVEAKTMHRACTVRTKKDYVLVDECFAADSRYIIITLFNTNAEKLILIGDPMQFVLRPAEGAPIIADSVDGIPHLWTQDGKMPKPSSHKWLANFRNPANIVRIMNQIFGTKAVPMRTEEIPIEYVHYNDAEAIDAVTITPTHATRVLLGYKEDDKVTIRSSQGKTHANVKMYLLGGLDGDWGAVKAVMQNLLVGATRHTNKLYIIYNHDDVRNACQLQFLESPVGENAVYRSVPASGETVVEVKPEEPVDVDKYPHPAYDSQLMKDIVSSRASLHPEATWNNELMRNLVSKGAELVPRMGRSTFAQLNEKGNVAGKSKMFTALSFGDGNQFTATSHQLFATMADRYKQNSANYQLGPQRKDFVHKMVQSYFDKMKHPGRVELAKALFRSFDKDDVFCSIMKRVKDHIGERNYIGRMQDPAFSDPSVLRVALKAAFKPSTDHKGSDPTKKGQTIASVDVAVTVDYLVFTRFLMTLDIFTDMRYDDPNSTVHVINDSGKSVQETMLEMNSAARQLFDGIEASSLETAISDVKGLDTAHNQVTIYAATYYDLMLGAPSWWPDSYARYRASLIAKSDVAVTQVKDKMPSGLNTTLYENGKVVKLTLNWVTVHSGPIICGVKGDDGMKVAAKGVMKISDVAKKELEVAFWDAKTIFDIYDIGEWCGYLVYGGKLYHDFGRVLKKVMGHKFPVGGEKDAYAHFAEVQISWRNKLDEMRACDMVTILALHAIKNLGGLGFMNLAWAHYDFLVAVSHANKKQFLEIVGNVVVDSEYVFSNLHTGFGRDLLDLSHHNHSVDYVEKTFKRARDLARRAVAAHALMDTDSEYESYYGSSDTSFADVHFDESYGSVSERGFGASLSDVSSSSETSSGEIAIVPSSSDSSDSSFDETPRRERLVRRKRPMAADKELVIPK